MKDSSNGSSNDSLNSYSDCSSDSSFKFFLHKTGALFKKDLMLSVSLVAAIVSLFITPPDRALLNDINWHTLATLFMLITVLEGFKRENIFEPVLNLTRRIKKLPVLTCFFVYSVFLSSMFVTNDVSLIIFVPLTIILFRESGNERFILPVLTFENIAAIRGSLLMPFGSPQNLFLFTQSGVSAPNFMFRMLPLWLFSSVLLFVFIQGMYFIDRKRNGAYASGSVSNAGAADDSAVSSAAQKSNRPKKILYISLFVIVVTSIVSRTTFWPYVTLGVFLALLIFDRKILLKTDYVLILTFFCFFVFSSSVCRNPKISEFLRTNVGGHEYVWSILLSQIISNVPASIVLWPFTKSLTALLYGLDSAGLCSIIGSLASVINLRLYIREYPGRGMKFIKTFTWISLLFFAVVVIPQWLLIKIMPV